ncbi:hypothetical protein [Acinetobacter sp. HY1485]|uniref:hypothetical protein n=1 Tax=Acinetobacter sp. HY1485 TaxID=2970918 RepID=UPI0022B949C3|nr:hypothetical protein [Acinetobacter sp. HY1485]
MDQQELQHLISVSTGFIDVYKVPCFEQAPMLLPQNIVLSAQTSKTSVKSYKWHDVYLPVYPLNNPQLKEAVALIIEGETAQQRFVLLCDEMPETMRLRISEMVDEDRPTSDEHIYQYVSLQNNVYQVPALDKIYNSIC